MRLSLRSNIIEYRLTFKNVKNINMRVKKEGLYVSAPYGTSIVFIENVLKKNQDALLGYIENMHKYTEQQKPFENGKTLLFLGKPYTLKIIVASEDNVHLSENEIIVYTKDARKAEAIFQNWLFQKAEVVFDKSLKRTYPLLSNRIKNIPDLKIKKLKASWGRCAPSLNKITISLWLIKADEPLIDYVMLHELCHYVHLDHSKDFYGLLSSLVPDYKQKRTLLNSLNKI